MKLLLLAAFLALLRKFAMSERILVLSLVSAKSHKICYMRLIEELANKGHDITVISPIKPFKNVPNIKEIYTFDLEKETFGKFDVLSQKEKNENINFLELIGDVEKACLKTYKLPQIQEILSQQFDMIFMPSLMNECALGIVYKLHAPLVIFAPTSVPDFTASRIGTRLPSSFVPNILTEFSPEMTFRERFLNFGINILFDVGSLWLLEPRMERLYRTMLNDESIPSVREIMGNASLILSNGHFSMSGPRPYLPDIVDVGGIHSRPAQKLPEDLEKFISKSGTQGFIYFSLGSIINTDSISEEKRKMFLRVFSKLTNYQIVWKWNGENMLDKPENVYLSSWLPQQDLLGHKKAKLFITHCGLGGTEEAVYHGVPLVGIPISGDQPLNAKLGKRLGILHDIDWNDLTEEILTAGINEVLQNPKYAENVKKLSTIFRDQPDDPLTRGVYWIEYVMRHKGAPHLRSASRKLNYFQYNSWDIIGVYLALICTSIYMLYAITKLVIRKITLCLFGSKDKNRDTLKMAINKKRK